MIKGIKLGLSYNQKSIQSIEQNIEQANQVERYCKSNNIKLIRRYSDYGSPTLNLMRPGLNELLKFLANTDNTIDIVIFNSVDRLERDFRRINTVLPKINKYANEVIIIKKHPSKTQFSKSNIFYEKPYSN
ncbi:recombinase family protein [Virgibacillus doumboii]|uniref:recombinase family protein n=1 Tax=Virgibacillus doumboii TaxID=2697503 RepID=UPI0013DF8331|nr:recombinase family protein [Virgibacillus doumboii]